MRPWRETACRPVAGWSSRSVYAKRAPERLYGQTGHDEVAVTDIDRAAVDAVELRSPVTRKHVIEPTPPLPFRDLTFDVVVSSDVFEHIPRDLRDPWARELARVVEAVNSCAC